MSASVQHTLCRSAAQRPMLLRSLACAGRSMARPLTRHMTAQASAMPAASISQHLRTLEELQFDTTFTRELPADPITHSGTRQVEGALFSYVSPTGTATEPTLVAASPDAARLLDLDPSELDRPEFAIIMAGAAPLPGAGKAYAQCYGGHQFGMWAGQLGDGRAISIGELVNSSGQRWELQLKGAGRTPYSRRADGRAVLRSSVREFVASEAMHALGIPTTRALSLVATGDAVARDMFYNGDVKYEPGAVVCRLAPSFVRFGTFQLPVSRGGLEVELTRMLSEYIVKHHYPHLQGTPNPHLSLLREVSQRTGHLVALWQSVGFVHGVLNTDNMSILGVTIDYGPYGFLDTFDPYWTPNLTDYEGRRYCYRAQPEVCQWNLAQLANALLGAGLVEKDAAEEALETYTDALFATYNDRMARKLGLKTYDKTLSLELLQLMAADSADFTNTFRALAHVPTAPEPQETAEGSGVEGADRVQSGSSATTSAASNGGDQSALETLSNAMNRAGGGAGSASGAPASQSRLPQAVAAALPASVLGSAERLEAWAQWVRVWRGRLAEEGVSDEERMAMQRAVSPKFVPRQHLLQYAIEAAERGDKSELETLMEVLAQPYDEQPEADTKYSSPPPPEMVRPGVCMLSCSS